MGREREKERGQKVKEWKEGKVGKRKGWMDRKGRKEASREGRQAGKGGNLSINERHSESFQFGTSPLCIPQIRLSRTWLLRNLGY